MAAKKGGLGRGLSSLFEETTASGGESTATLRIADISPDREHPRKSFDDEALSELAAEGKIAEISQKWFGRDDMIIVE